MMPVFGIFVRLSVTCFPSSICLSICKDDDCLLCVCSSVCYMFLSSVCSSACHARLLRVCLFVPIVCQQRVSISTCTYCMFVVHMFVSTSTCYGHHPHVCLSVYLSPTYLSVHTGSCPPQICLSMRVACQPRLCV